MAMIVTTIMEILVKRLADLAEKEILRLLGMKMKDDLVQLKETIFKIKVFLDDAESREISERSFSLCLADLHEIMYDADDLLDDCRVQAEKNQAASQTNSTRRYRFVPSSLSRVVSVSFRQDIGKRIQEINSALQKLQSEIQRLKLIADLTDFNRTFHFRSSKTTSFLVESAIVGIDDDAKGLVDMLTRGVSQKCRCSIYAITGMPGIGKTTLATKVYRDSRIRNHFDIQLWICVSKTYSEVELLKEMVGSITWEEYRGAETKAELCSKIRELVRNKKFFLVLDDVWNEKVWEDLFRETLHDASNGSRVLVTTRQKRTAMRMGATYCHQVVEMKDEEGWSMLCKVVSKDEEDEKEIQKYQKVGMEIVQKCKGLPLAIKVVAGVLRIKDRTLRAWESVRSWAFTEFPEDIMQGLLLSYDDLPSYLKQCFVYTSLFPGGFTFHRPNLVQMWIAEGFVKENIGSLLSMEDLGDEYYNELVMRNLLQEVPDYFENSGCKMHDLVRSLALYVSQNEHIYEDLQSVRRTTMKPRHLSFVKKEVDMVPDMVENYKSLRTLLLSKNPCLTKIRPELFQKLTRLRVLDISYTGVQSLPDSVGNLIQLRFLSVAFTEIKCLPNSIRKLKNLETLKANGSKYLHRLPDGVTQLQKLRHLTVGGSDTPFDYMPLGMENLKKLRTLTGFVANGGTPREGSNLKDLRGLSDLTDLSMYKLENVASKEDSKKAETGKKECLRYLRLSCSQRIEESSSTDAILHGLECKEIKRIEEVFEGLNPPRTLEKLHIEGFFGHVLPSFVTGCTLHSLTWLRFEDCRLLKTIPPIGMLSKLTVLQIWGATSVSEIVPEFFGGPDGFPQLQELYLWGMLELETIAMIEQGAMRCLKILDIEKCPKLKSLPAGLNHIESLRQLVIEGCENLETIDNICSVTELELKRNSKLKTISNLPALSFMSIKRCSSLDCVKDVNNLSHVLLSADKMQALPQWLQNTKLKKLDVHGNTRLISRMCNGGADWPIVRESQCVEARSRDGLSYMSYRKEDPVFFETNITNNIGASSPSISLNAEIPRLKQITDLPDSSPTLHNFVPDQSSWRQTTSVLMESDIVGIDGDVKHLLDMLIGGVDQRSNCPIYAITGMGGIGKTTLAEKVFIDLRITNHFEITMWIHVSNYESFSNTSSTLAEEVELLKEMVRSLTCQENTVAETKVELLSKIRELVRHKRFFLVLDDIRSEKVWKDLLEEPLRGADHGSRVLITTRGEAVAQSIGAVYCHQVQAAKERRLQYIAQG